jgi:leucyl aminopeptidase
MPILSFSKSPENPCDTVVLLTSEKRQLGPIGNEIDSKAHHILSHALKLRDKFKGRHGDALSVFLPKGAGYDQALLIGVGPADKADRLAFENLGGKIFSHLQSVQAQNVAVIFDISLPKDLNVAEMATALASGMALKNYRFDKYKPEPKKDKSGDSVKNKDLVEINIALASFKNAERHYQSYEGLAAAVNFSRDLVNEAPNILYPESYAAIIAKTLKPLGVEVEILDERKMEKIGFHAHLAVGQGSARPPRVVIMRWNGVPEKSISPSKKSKGKDAPLAFVGKGVTFDTGGISIKPAAGMEEMKMDMGGSAAVAGLLYALAATKAKVDVVGIVGLAENMPSDRAYRPGDIIQSLSGKTIEVLNTDAEGRLVLADSLTYVQRTYKPRMIIDLATLTGAIMVALGQEYAGAFVNDNALWDDLENASKVSGEKLWRMPLDEAYRDEMKGSVSDLKNLGNQGRYGGACSAAGFLEMFIEGETPWAHLDIAGTAWIKSDKPTVPKGGTGFGVRLLYNFVTALKSKK